MTSITWQVLIFLAIAILCYIYLVTGRIIDSRRAAVPLHFPTTHFTGVTVDGMKFVYCPVGNIVSWSEGDYDHKWCHYEHKFFEELNS